MDLNWLAPAPLEGVKSRKKPLFKIDQATVTLDDSGIEVSGLALTLDSRIAAIGDAGRSLVDMLLSGCVPAKAYVHESLNCFHVGPHLAGATASYEQHKKAVSDGLRKKPHVVILDEALSARSKTHGTREWLRFFSEILRSESFAAFKGAIVVCSCEETFAVRKLCSERWLHKKTLQQEQITGRGFQIIENAIESKESKTLEKSSGGRAQRRGGQRGAAADSEAFLEEARELSDFIFEEDLLKFAREKDWKVALLVEEAASGVQNVRGYLTYKHEPDAEIHVERLAVSPQQRKRGHGRRLMQWLSEEMMRLPSSECAKITCSAFDEVVPFYQSLGFATCPKPEGKEEHAGSDPATWMECRNNSLIDLCQSR